MRKKIFNILALGALLLTASCSLHDDNEVFDEPAAQRIQDAVANYKTLLESASNGWELHLWMGEDYSAGGYTYLMKFANDKVTVASDISGYNADDVSTSSYGINQDEGPVLTVNTYNSIFHDLANPTQDGSEVEQDYEFVITGASADNDSIFLRGKKYGNNMVMTRIPTDLNWANHLQVIKDEEDNMMANFNILVGGDSVGTAVISGRQATITTDAGEESIPYVVTETGVELQRPFIANGVSVQYLTYNADPMTFTSPSDGSITLTATFPENYMYYDEFVGRWRLYYYYGIYSQYVTLTANSDNKTYTMSGFNGFTVQVQYHKPSGGIRIYAQQVATTSAGNYIYMITTDGSYIYWSLSNGFGFTRNMRYTSQIRLTPTDLTGAGVNGFYLGEFTGAPSNSTYQSGSSTVTFTGTRILMQRITRMVKQ